MRRIPHAGPLVAVALLLGSATAEAQQSFSDPVYRQPDFPTGPQNAPPAPPYAGRPSGTTAGTPPNGGPPADGFQDGRRQPLPGVDPEPPPSDRLDALMQAERQDFGVPPPQGLHAGPPHGPTPNRIPGGQVITTKGLSALLQNRQVPTVVLDILGGPRKLPNAILAVPASQPGSFQDAAQQQFAQFLNGVTRGNRETAIVLYCQNVQCWMSYNAAARAIALGYRNVLWYRGGIEAWTAAGLQTVPQG